MRFCAGTPAPELSRATIWPRASVSLRVTPRAPNFRPKNVGGGGAGRTNRISARIARRVKRTNAERCDWLALALQETLAPIQSVQWEPMSGLRLGVNVDHIATLRQGRYASIPDSKNAEPDRF